MKYFIFIFTVIIVVLIGLTITSLRYKYTAPCEEILKSNLTISDIPARCLPLIDQGNISGLRK